MSWQTRCFNNFRLYAVTDSIQPGPHFLKTIESIYSNGVDIVQLRSKTISMSEKIRLGRAIRKIATRARKLYFVNDSIDLALLTDADGLHVGQDDVSPSDIRSLYRKLKKQIFVGLSTHSVSQAKVALKQPVDYFGVGPVFKTPTKPSYDAVGLKLLKQVCRFATKPWVAIGGIDESNVNQLLLSGAKRIAVVRAIFGASDPGMASKNLINKLKGNHHD